MQCSMGIFFNVEPEIGMNSLHEPFPVKLWIRSGGRSETATPRVMRGGRTESI